MASIFMRAFEPEDVLLINKWRNDPEIQSMTGGIIRKVSSEMEKAWLHDKMMNNYNEIYWAICLNDETKRMIGYTSINKIDYINRTAEGGGTVIGEKECRDGISLIETVLILLEYVFNTLNLNRFEAKCLFEHKTPQALLLSLKFKLEGFFRKAVYKNGDYHDMLYFAILREDYYNALIKGDLELRSIIKRINLIQNEKHQINIVL